MIDSYHANTAIVEGRSHDATLHLQLYRYAEDLQMLLDQHAELEEKHQHLKKSHEHLVESKDILDNLIRCAGDFYIVTDGAGVIKHASPSAGEKLMPGAATLQGLSLRQLLAPSHFARFDELLAGARTETPGQRVEQWEFVVYIGGDPAQALMVDAWVLPVSSAGELSVYWIMRDISVKRTNEFESQISSMVFRSAHEGIMITDIEGQIIAVNPAFTRITEYTEEEVIGKNPRLLASGRHGKEFYRAFWEEIIETGTWNGQIINRKKGGQLYPEWVTISAVKDESGATLSYIAVFSDITRFVETEKVLSNLAYHDTLTGLPNRRLLEDRAEQALAAARRSGSGVSILYLDLDRFKPVNDNLGHQIGDLVLQQVSQRMTEAIREGDTVARVGGDEFVILALGSSLDSDRSRMAQKLIDALSAPIFVAGHEVLIGSSIGCARFPQDGTDIATLLKHADIAMYSAKRAGGNHYCLFEEPIGAEQGTQGITLGAELWHALERQELYLVYQPQVSCSGHDTLLGCEALLRWRHPILGDMPPSRFIPVAEKNGSIVPIGAWALKAACQQLQEWKSKGLANITLSVNVSPRQLRSNAFEETLACALLESGIDPALLELEITESEIMMHQEANHCRLLPLRALGVKIAIDDFGTGYSSLSRLKHLPIDRLKIDKSFVHDLETNCDSQAISSCIVGMGLAMGLEVIAEGVETLEQLQRLNAQGCHLVQGYLIGRPMRPDIFLQWALERERVARQSLDAG
ncbi:putative bifunctional diguanylate cyclase/phosphodiesterase [Propionivibrio sp.]|uniref:putative bifunctional diguanylate cyclase/phosphodiesterase n=1 Tax=Propionivibrio sp. TaxID=2212460 RepID=UPI003BF0F467